MNIPKGYKLVPVEPTAEMLAAEIAPVLCLGNPETPRVEQWRRGLYTAMLAAAPAPPQHIYDETKERELFEAFWKSNMNVKIMDLHRNIYPMNSGWSYTCCETNRSWMTWLACAQSRAKSVEVDHE